MLKTIAFLAALMAFTQAHAAEVEGVVLPEQVDVGGNILLLNGAGVRTKFFFDIYVGALYLPEKIAAAEKVLLIPAPARVSMNILYKKVSAGKLTKGWQQGFEKNQAGDAMRSLEKRLNAFNAMFGDAYRGEQLIFDFLPDGATRIVVNGLEKGSIQGVDFQRALLAVWLGKKPADDALKQAMLGR